MASSTAKQAVETPLAFQTPFWNPAVLFKPSGTLFVSGNIGMDYPSQQAQQAQPSTADIPSTLQHIPGTVADRTRKAIQNMDAVLLAAGSGLDKLLKVNIYLTSMSDYAAMNAVWEEMIPNPKPARTCVAVKELPFLTDVST